MYSPFNVSRSLQSLALILSVTGLLAGCGSERSLTGADPVSPEAPPVEVENRIVAHIDFEDGSRIEFQDDGGLLSIVGMGLAVENEARSFIDGGAADAVEFYERVTGASAPAALVEAHRRLAWYRPGPIAPPEPESVEAPSDGLSPLSLSGDEFRSGFCGPGGFCYLNRTGNMTLYKSGTSFTSWFHSVSGSITYSVQKWDGWAGVYRTKTSVDVSTNRFGYWSELNFFTEYYRVLVTRASGNTWHLSAY